MKKGYQSPRSANSARAASILGFSAVGLILVASSNMQPWTLASGRPRTPTSWMTVDYLHRQPILIRLRLGGERDKLGRVARSGQSSDESV